MGKYTEEIMRETDKFGMNQSLSGEWMVKRILIPSGTIIGATIVKNLEVHAQGGNDTK